MSPNQLLAALPAAAFLLCACSPDTLTAAGSNATSAAIAAKQAQQEKAMADQRIRAMQESLDKHDRSTAEQLDRGTQ